MPLIRLEKVCLSYGTQIILDEVGFTLRKGDKICLIGRNGVGKSTCLKLIANQIQAESGVVKRRPDAVIAVLSQELPEADEQTVYDYVASGLEDLGKLLKEYRLLSHDGAADLNKLQHIQQQIEVRDGWRFDNRIQSVMTRLKLPATQQMKELSGGWRRRVALARALVTNPDCILLDEPTNHLDIPTIDWLEKQLLEFSGALLFVTHDRRLVKKLATGIAELDRGVMTVWDGDYASYEADKVHRLEVEARHNELFDKKLAQEEVWIRQGIKARRTRNEGRVRALLKLREERKARRELTGKASFKIDDAQLSGKLVAELEGVSFAYGEEKVIDNFSLRIMRGDRIGFIGINGSGKSTLLKIILGDLKPQSGKFRKGTKIDIAYFDQLRRQINPEATVIDNVAEGREFIDINGKPRHVISYLQDFLFAPDRTRIPVKALSGGEVNRLLLAKMFSQPSNLLVMDEPTNDLDVESLELLEEVLMDYKGTLLLVSHDREFLDNVVSSSLVFEGNGSIVEYVGGYSDWLQQGGDVSRLLPVVEEEKKLEVDQVAEKPVKKEAKKSTKLSYKLQRELDELPERINGLEAKLEALEALVSAPGFYEKGHEEVAVVLAEVGELQEAIEEAYERWEELEGM